MVLYGNSIKESIYLYKEYILRRKILFTAVSFSAGILSAYLFFEYGSLIITFLTFFTIFLLFKRDFLNGRIIVSFICGVAILSATFFSMKACPLQKRISHMTCCNAVVKKVEEKERGYQLVINVKTGLPGGSNVLVQQKNKSGSIPFYLTGRHILCTVVPEKPESNPGSSFNWRNYLYSENIWYTSDVFFLKETGKLSPLRIPDAVAVKLREDFMSSYKGSKEEKAFVKGILFGITDNIEKDTADLFRFNGTAHILAVSGLHIGIIFGLYSTLKKHFKSGCFTFVFILFLFFYSSICLWSFSVIRAVSLIIIRLYADLKCLRFDPVCAMSFIFITSLIINPFTIFNTGFQMSFLAAGSIAFIIPFFKRNAPEISSGTVITFLLQPVLGPYMLHCFGTFSPIGILVNIPTIFITGLIVPLGIAELLFFILLNRSFVPVSEIINSLVFLITEINRLAFADGKFVISAQVSLTFTMLFYGFFFYLSSEYFSIMKNRKDSDILSVPIVIILSVFVVSIIR